MRSRATIAIAVAAASLASAIWAAAPAAAGTICTWGGTPAAPTGTFTLNPGLTTTPVPEPLAFRATGPLAGGPGCSGKLTFIGQFHAGSSCRFLTADGRVKGLPGVARFAGAGNVIAPSLLYDAQGNVVGSDQAQVHQLPGDSQFEDCDTAKGYTHAHFSSVVELF
jgi:hypothetical protein